MNKKLYFAPMTETMAMEVEEMIAATTLNSAESSQSVTPTAEEYIGEFTSRVLFFSE